MVNRGIQIVHHKETLKAVEGIAPKPEYICQYAHLPKSCDMEEKSKPKIRRGLPWILYP